MPLLKPIVENLAEKIAASQGGRVNATALFPYLPLPIAVIEKHLDEMVDNTFVSTERVEGIKYYEFNELIGTTPQVIPEGKCLYSGELFTPEKGRLLCPKVEEALSKELLLLAEVNAWPAEAVWQHELIHIASKTKGPLLIADIAGNSRYPLKQVKRRLIELAKAGAITQVLDKSTQQYHYELPELYYPEDAFQRNKQTIHQHPSSYKEEFETKLTKAVVALIIIVAITFVLAFAIRINFLFLLLLATIAGAISTTKILTEKIEVKSR